MKSCCFKFVCFLFSVFIINSFWVVPALLASDGLDIKTGLEEKGISGTLIDINVGINVPKSENPYIPPGEEDVNLWATVVRPVQSGSEKLPTILLASGYTRFVTAIASFLLPHGYNVMVLDLRGCGSSGGEWGALDQVEQYDVKYVIDDWIPAQEWSNGKVGVIGFSYLSIITMLASGMVDRDEETGEPTHLKAIVPISFFSDTYREVASQGGNMNIELLLTWVVATNTLAAALPPFLFLGDDNFSPTEADIEEAYDIWNTHVKQMPKDLGWLMDMDHQKNTPFWKKKSPMLY